MHMSPNQMTTDRPSDVDNNDIPNIHMRSLPIKFIEHMFDREKSSLINEQCESSHFNGTVKVFFDSLP